jgi:hypothetical protein
VCWPELSAYTGNSDEPQRNAMKNLRAEFIARYMAQFDPTVLGFVDETSIVVNIFSMTLSLLI